MEEKQKTLKEYAKEAKKRLKSGFWEKYQKNLQQEMERAKENGISESKVKDYFAEQVAVNIRNKEKDNEEFYQKVKKILDEQGEVSNIIGMLTDHQIFDNLSYDEKQRYTLSLSENYLKAVERYNKEKSIISSN